MTERKHQVRKTFENEHCIIFDDFLPEDVYQHIYGYSCDANYEHINSQGHVARAWRIRDGFPLRSTLNMFCYADDAKRPDESWCFPTNTPLDLFASWMNSALPYAERLVGKGGQDWDRYSVTSWLYPSGTALSLHDDGAGIYSGAYAYFINPVWDIHWGGLLLLLDPKGSQSLQDHKKTQNPNAFYRRKWLEPELELDHLWDPGMARCIFPKRNRLVFIHNEAYHLVTQVNAGAGTHVRQSLAGFFHRPDKTYSPN